MSKSGYANKSKFLGLSYGTAQNRLRNIVLFALLEKHNENVCYRCGKKIETVGELSIEHKNNWIGISIDLFWDLDNVAFSHRICNYGNHSLPDRGIDGRFRSSG